MPIVPLKLNPTVNVEYTETLNEAGISACNLIRFKAKLPQKLGGWEKFYPFDLDGVPRALHAFEDLGSEGWLAYASTTQLVTISDGAAQDITPQTLESDFTPDFTTTSGSAVVEIDDPNIEDVTTYDSVLFNTPVSVGGIILRGVYRIATITGGTTYTIIADANAAANVASGGAVPVFDTTSGSALVSVTLEDHGLSAGDRFTFLMETTVGGVTIAGTYTVVSVSSVDVFVISVDGKASTTASAAMNGGEAQLLYYINLGPASAGSGYGVGPYGEGAYGLGTTPGEQTGTPITATDWTLDNWGEIILGCPANGAIYQWQPNTGFQNAGLVENAPIFNGGIFVAMPAQILVAWGSTLIDPLTGRGDQQDPLQVNWSTNEDFTVWNPQSTNQAGGFRIPTGSRIVGGLQGPQQALIWTDIDAYAMVYQGAPYVFGFNKISSGCGLIGRHAAAVMRGNVYWMGIGNFFTLGGGGVQVIPCSVWDVVFQDLDATNQHKCVAAPNSTFSEMWFFYPSESGGTGECDSYVKYNIDEPSWDYGSMPRTAWIDQSVLGQPIGANPDGVIYQHESGFDADGQAMNWWFETGYFTISQAQDMAFVDWFFPDMKFGPYNGSQNATVQVTITAVDYPNATERSYGPFPITAGKNYVNTRLRGRQVKMKFEGNDVGTFARLGNMRFRVAKDGRR